MGKVKRVSPLDLMVENQAGNYFLFFRGKPILTREGTPVSHGSPDLICHMIAELDSHGYLQIRKQVIEEPRFFCASSLYTIQKDWIEKNTDELSVNFERGLLRDQILYRCAGPEVVEQIARWTPVFEFLKELDLRLPSLVAGMAVNREDFADEETYREALKTARPDPEFVGKLEQAYRRLSPPQRTVSMVLHALHEGVLFPLVLARNCCDANEYASGVLASWAMIGGVFPDVSHEDHNQAFMGLKNDARTALEYLSFFPR